MNVENDEVMEEVFQFVIQIGIRGSHVKHWWQTSVYNCVRMVQNRVQP